MVSTKALTLLWFSMVKGVVSFMSRAVNVLSSATVSFMRLTLRECELY